MVLVIGMLSPPEGSFGEEGLTELCRPAQGELYRPAPGEWHPPAQGELYRPAPGEWCRPTPGELYRPVSGVALRLAMPAPGNCCCVTVVVALCRPVSTVLTWDREVRPRSSGSRAWV